MVLEFMEFLSRVPDARRAQGKKWRLEAVLLATILAILSGATSYRQVHSFIQTHLDRLNAAFGLGWKTAPAYSAVRTILHGMDGHEVERVFRAHAAKLVGGADLDADADIEAMPVVAIDGKTLRHSFDAFHDRKAAHVLSAFAANDALILGHLEVADKSNEIPAVQDLIATLGLEGRLITLDAMHCQKNISGGPQGQGSSACPG